MASPFAPQNTDVPSSFEPPGTFFQLRTAGAGAAGGDLGRRVLLLAHKTASGTGQLHFPIRCPGKALAAQYAGSGSDAARAYQALVAQIGEGVADVYLLLVAEPAGTQATRTIIVSGTPTKAGSVDLWICGYLVSVRIAQSDTPTTIAAAIRDAVNAITALPVVASASTGTVTLTYRHAGLVGNDIPVILNQTDADGITFSPGTIAYTNAAVGAGSATVTIGGTTITAALAGGETAAGVATKVAAAINGGSFPVRCSDDGNGTLTLLYAADRVVNKVSAAIVTTTGTTVAVSCGAVAPNNGSNRPTLTTALANLANQDGGFRLWLSTWNDAATIGTLAAHIESQASGLYQKEQYLHVGSTDGIVTAGALPASTTPALTGLWRYSVDVCPDSPQQAYEEAARCVGMIVAEDYIPKNYDGTTLKTDAAQRTPNLLPHPAVRIAPTSDDAQTALHSYGLTPICVTFDGRKVVAKGRTTWQTDPMLRDWGVAQHLGFLRQQFIDAGSKAIAGKSIRKNGVPRSPNVTSITNVRAALIARARDLDLLDLFDGIDVWKDAFVLSFNPQTPDRIDGYIPLAVIRGLHTLGLVGDVQ